MIKHIMKKNSFIMIGFSLLLVCSLVFSAAQSLPVNASAKDDKIVLGYYASWAPPSEDFDPNKVTHLNYSFADVCWEGQHGNPNNEEIPDGEDKVWACEDLDGHVNEDLPNGTIVLYDSETDLEELPKVAAMKEENPALKTLVSVGGWTLSNNLSLVADSEETRENFAKSAVDFVKKFDMDGLDLDWEYPNHDGHPGNNLGPEDTENHTKLLQAVRDAFDEETAITGKEYLVTIAGAATWAYQEKNELDKISEIVDYVAVMAYDINGTWSGVTGHNAPLYHDPLEAEIRGWNFGIDGVIGIYSEVPKEKLVLGLPFYGHSWGGCNTDTDGDYVPERGAYQDCKPAWEVNPSVPGTVGYDVVKSLINKDGYKYYFDNVSKAPYLYNAKKAEFISYDNVESLGYKVNFIIDEGLAGAMIWDLGTDDADYNLLKTVSHGLGLTADEPEPDPEPNPEPEPDPDPDPEPNPDPSPDPDPNPDLDPKPDLDPEPNPDTNPKPDPDPNQEPNPEPDPDPDPKVDNNKNTNIDNNKANDEKSGERLPDTATNLFNFLLIGSVLLLSGVGFYLFQRRRQAAK